MPEQLTINIENKKVSLRAEKTKKLVVILGKSDCLGEKDGYEIYTLTDVTREKFNPPSDCYKEVIIQGLVETGLSEKMAKEYLENRIKEQSATAN